MKKRVFVAIDLSRNLQHEISLWKETQKEKFPVRWLESKNLHITLIPPWYEENIEEVVAKLKNTKSFPFEIEFHNIDFGPRVHAPRLIWVEGNVPQEILTLKKSLEKNLNKKSETRPFKTHITLARFRPEHFSSFPIKSLDEKVEWGQTVDSIVLMESALSPSGAHYEILARVKMIK